MCQSLSGMPILLNLSFACASVSISLYLDLKCDDICPPFVFFFSIIPLFGEGTLHFLIKNRIILPFTHSFTHRETDYDWNENKLGEKRAFKFLSLLTHNTYISPLISAFLIPQSKNF